MAPRTTPGASRRGQAQNERLYTLGVQGRKTGITLPDSGIRDEHGMEPLDIMFSSPQKATAGGEDDEDYSSDGGPMDIDNTTAPDPATFLNGGLRLPLPKTRSPARTNIKSPAKQNPHLGPTSSPTRGSVITPHEPAPSHSVKRRLDFSMEKRPAVTLHPVGTEVDGNSQRRPATRLTNGHYSEEEDDDEEAEEALLRGQENIQPAIGDDSVNMIFGDDDDPAGILGAEEVNGEEDEDESVLATGRNAANSRREKTAKTAKSREAAEGGGDSGKRKRGRPPAARSAQQGSSTNGNSSKRPRALRNSGGDEQGAGGDDDDDDDERSPKRPRAEPKRRGRKPGKGRAEHSDDAEEDSAPVAKKGPGRPKGKRKVSAGADTSAVIVPRGPPLPRGPGLVISRREVPGDAAVVQTRSGRNSYKPLAYWRNEHVDYDQDETAEDAFAPKSVSNRSRFLLPAIKEIHRVEELEGEKKKRPRAGGGGGGRRRGAGHGYDDDDLPPDEWEEEEGHVVGDVAVWKPAYEFAPPPPNADVDVVEEQVALSAAAVQTREIKDAEFRFAKTLSLPFFGCGVVDMPPGSVKRPKNARKMFMSFFVHTGRVRVTINETSFRISKGGMWFVPRGNYYSIENDSDRDSRIFFSQGCEVAALPEDE